MSRSSRTSRRRFLMLVGAAGLSTSLMAPAVLAQGRPRQVRKPPLKPEPAAPSKTDGPAAPPPPSEFADDARALALIIERRYGKHLDANQLEQITKELDGRLQAGKALRAVKLGNHDEPDFTFHA